MQKLNNISIIGSGFMGTQIGLQCAIHDKNVNILYHSEKSLLQSKKIIENELNSNQSYSDRKDNILNKINFVQEIDKAVKEADLVIETVVENLKIKREVFSQIDKFAPNHTILATNSSSITISEIESATNRLKKVLNAHFYPPILQRPMVEIMGGTQTSSETIAEFIAFAKEISLTPLIVKKESTGFIFNRIWRTIKKEALNVVDQGVASHQDVDRAWMITSKMPVGLFGLMDMVGLDVIRDVALVYHSKSGDDSDLPPKILLDKIENGDLGQKTGKGFYSYPNPSFQDPDWIKGD